jgi:hypothetical protein
MIRCAMMRGIARIGRLAVAGLCTAGAGAVPFTTTSMHLARRALQSLIPNIKPTMLVRTRSGIIVLTASPK